MDSVVHFEIPADDYDRAKKFYTQLFGWQIMEWPGSPTKYGMATTTPVDQQGQPTKPGAINGAVMPRASGVTSTVITIRVSSIDDYSKKIAAAGGKMKMPKTKVGDMGYNASFIDPEGNVVGLWEDIQK